MDAGKEDCYWQYVHPGATLYVSAQVLKGGDSKIGVAVRDPGGKVVLPYKWQASAEYEEASAQAGYWSVCLDNQFSKFSAKLVNLYLTTFRYDEWEKFAEDLQVRFFLPLESCTYSSRLFQDLDMSVGNFTQVLQGVDRRIQVMRQFQQLSRGLESRDYNILVSNFSYVSNWSLIQVLVVIMSGIVQVYFVKKLFADPKQGAGKSKTRI